MKKTNFLIHFSQNSAKIIQNLDSGNLHGHDNISIWILKICGSAICKPLAIICKQCVDAGIFPSAWKKGDIVPIHKKDDKETIRNFRPVSLLPINGKIFERLTISEMFKFFIKNELISPNQSGFKPDDSCVNQLVSITHEIYLLTKVMKLGVFTLILG